VTQSLAPAPLSRTCKELLLDLEGAAGIGS
jgi:hypothetical protein